MLFSVSTNSTLFNVSGADRSSAEKDSTLLSMLRSIIQQADRKPERGKTNFKT